MTQYDQSDMRGLQGRTMPSVDGLADCVISMLRERQAVTGSGARQFVLDQLMRAVKSPGAFDPVRMLEELRGHRLTVDEIIDVYVPQIARLLGQQWLEDDASFATVTIAALRLQSLLGEASAEMPVLRRSDSADLQTFVIVPAGEQHFLGAKVLGAQLRRMGCEVDTSFHEPLGEMAQRLRLDPPHLILISCAGSATLERIAPIVVSIRNALHPAPLIALGGSIGGDADVLKELTGVDLVTSVAKEAVSFCLERMKASGLK